MMQHSAGLVRPPMHSISQEQQGFDPPDTQFNGSRRNSMPLLVKDDANPKSGSVVEYSSKVWWGALLLCSYFLFL